MRAVDDWEPALAVLGAVWIFGVWFGLWLAWTQRARMDRYAVSVWLQQAADGVQRKVNEWEGYGDVVDDRSDAGRG